MKREEFLSRRVDMAAAAAWKQTHLLGPAVPPVRFRLDGMPGDRLSWTKAALGSETFTDYPDDRPVRRTEERWQYRAGDLVVDLEITAYPDYPVVEYAARLTNAADAPSPVLEDLLVIDADVCGDPMAKVHSCLGSSYCVDDFKPDATASLRDGQQSFDNGSLHFASGSGKPTRDLLQFFNVESDGGGTIAALSWQGNWRADFTRRAEGIRMTAGQLKTEFALLPGESFRFPRIVLLFYRGSRADGQNVWRRWFYEHNSLRVQGVRMTRNVITCIGDDYPGMRGNGADDIREARMLRDTGAYKWIDHFIQDAGWYTCGGDEAFEAQKTRPAGADDRGIQIRDGWYQTGCWSPDPARYPGGLRPVSDEMHACGMKYGVWFEPERFYPDTQMERDLGEEGVLVHPDPSVPSRLIHYGAPGAVEYVVDFLDRNLNEGGIDLYRQDFNINPAPFWSLRDAEDSKRLGLPRYGVTEEKYATGYLRMLHTLAEHHPGMIFDACASGGMRIDLDTMRIAFPHTRSDMFADPVGAQNQTYGIAMWYPLYGGGVMDVRDPYLRRSALVTSLGLGFRGLTGEEMERCMGEWQRLEGYLLYDFYPLTPYSARKNCAVAMQFDSPEEGKGMANVFVRGDAAREARTIRLRGLEPDASYRVSEIDSPECAWVASGAELMETGVSVAPSEPDHAWVFFYERL